MRVPLCLRMGCLGSWLSDEDFGGTSQTGSSLTGFGLDSSPGRGGGPWPASVLRTWACLEQGWSWCVGRGNCLVVVEFRFLEG